MQQTRQFKLLAGLVVLAACPVISVPAFEGYINASSSRGGPAIPMLYTVGTNCVRVEILDTNSPNTVDLVDRSSGMVTLVFPQNRCFMRLTAGANNSSGQPPGFPSMQGRMPPGMGQPSGNASGAPVMPSPPQMPGSPAGQAPGAMPPGIGPTNFPGMPGSRSMSPMPQRPPMPQMPAMAANGGMPAMPMPPMMAGNLEPRATGATTNLLGYVCEGFQIQQHDETMIIWATDQLLPFQVYLPNEPHRFGPPMIEEQWGKLFTAKKLFPLLASLRAANGMERYRFEVQSIKPAMLGTNEYNRLQPPADYAELHQHPF